VQDRQFRIRVVGVDRLRLDDADVQVRAALRPERPSGV
jgi:hypothetical protein